MKYAIQKEIKRLQEKNININNKFEEKRKCSNLQCEKYSDRCGEGFIIRGDFTETYAEPCDIYKIYKQQKKLSDYRLPKIDLESLKTSKGMISSVEVCKRFINDLTGNKSNSSMLLTGRSGSGKTTLAKATLKAVLKNKIENEESIKVEFFDYRKDITELTAIKMDYDRYRKKMDNFINADILLIDDLFKGKVTDGEIKTVYELINDRYTQNKSSIITTELSFIQLSQIDEAIAGRIYEECKKFIIKMEDVNRRIKVKNNEHE